jgi:hypothetical protein
MLPICPHWPAKSNVYVQTKRLKSSANTAKGHQTKPKQYANARRDGEKGIKCTKRPPGKPQQTQTHFMICVAVVIVTRFGPPQHNRLQARTVLNKRSCMQTSPPRLLKRAPGKSPKEQHDHTTNITNRTQDTSNRTTNKIQESSPRRPKMTQDKSKRAPRVTNRANTTSWEHRLSPKRHPSYSFNTITNHQLFRMRSILINGSTKAQTEIVGSGS